MNAPLVIAVDGPAASGKGTIARALGMHYGLPHLDTGLLYRAVGMLVGEFGTETEAAEIARAFDPAWLCDPSLRTEQAAHLASKFSAHPPVRAALLDFQRTFAAKSEGAVLDGRDIGTVIVPNATAKLFVTADLIVRQRRRYAELPQAHMTGVYLEISARDARDTHRETAPLRKADDADLLDTTQMAIDVAVRRAIALVEARIGRMR